MWEQKWLQKILSYVIDHDSWHSWLFSYLLISKTVIKTSKSEITIPKYLFYMYVHLQIKIDINLLIITN